MSWVQDTGKKEAANVDNLAYSFTRLPTVGNLVGVGTSMFAGSANSTITVTDNQGNVYTKDVEPNPSGVFLGVAIVRTVVQTSSGTFTVTIDGATNAGNYIVSGAAEFNQVSALLLDRTASNTTGTATSVTTGNTSAVRARAELNLACLAAAVNSTNCNIAMSTAGYIAVWTEQDAATFNGGQFSWGISLVADTRQGAWTFNTVDGSRCCIATYYMNVPSMPLMGVGV